MSETLGKSGSARTPAGWYPADGELRWWDGAQWTEHRAPLAPANAPGPGTASPGPVPVSASASVTGIPTAGAVTDETAPLYPYKDPSSGPSAADSSAPFLAQSSPAALGSSPALYAHPGGATPTGTQPVPYAGGYEAAQPVAYSAHPVPYRAPYSAPFSAPYGAYPVVYTDARTNGAAVAIAWVVTVLTFGYMLPWAIAATRGKSNSWAVGLVNFLLGWTFIGWVVALVMACTSHQVVAAR